MKLYLVRHGESEANLKRVLAGGKVNSPLTKKGKEQAVQVAKKLVDIQFDYVVVSPLERTVDTANIICSQIGWRGGDISYDNRVVEFNVGDAAGMPIDEYRSLVKAGHLFNGAETFDEIRKRVSAFLDDMKSSVHENILVVGHNGTGRMMRLVAANKSNDEFHSVPNQANDEIITLTIE